MNKRGQSEIWSITTLFEVLAGLVVGGILFFTMLNLNDNPNYNKAYLEEDYKLVLSMIKGLPGDISYSYSTGSFEMKEGEIERKGVIRGEKWKVVIEKEGDEISSKAEKDEKKRTV